MNLKVTLSIDKHSDGEKVVCVAGSWSICEEDVTPHNGFNNLFNMPEGEKATIVLPACPACRMRFSHAADTNKIVTLTFYILEKDKDGNVIDTTHMLGYRDRP
jgi:Fe-S oxidoreductase